MVIRRLGLDHSHDNILGLVELILVESMVFRGGPIKPCRALTLHQYSPSSIDVKLNLRDSIEIVICGPNPHIFEIRRGVTGQV